MQEDSEPVKISVNSVTYILPALTSKTMLAVEHKQRGCNLQNLVLNISLLLLNRDHKKV